MEFQNLKEGEDFYLTEEGLMVFTASYLLKRGYCCESGCRHCPYGFFSKTSPIPDEKGGPSRTNK